MVQLRLVDTGFGGCVLVQGGAVPDTAEAINTAVFFTAMSDTGGSPCVTWGFLCLTWDFWGLRGCVLAQTGLRQNLRPGPGQQMLDIMILRGIW